MPSDLTPGQRKAAFAVIVLVLAGLGVYLLGVRQSPAPQRPTPPRAVASRTPGSSVVRASTPAPAASSASGGGVNIYQWLPFSQAGLASAATTVRAFAADYATYTSTTSPSVYVGRMTGLVTAQLSATLAQDFATPGLAQARKSQQQSATGGGEITSLRTFGPSSMTFLVTVTQAIKSSKGTSQQSTAYAITTTGAGTAWLVSDIELASAGNS